MKKEKEEDKEEEKSRRERRLVTFVEFLKTFLV